MEKTWDYKVYGAMHFRTKIALKNHQKLNTNCRIQARMNLQGESLILYSVEIVREEDPILE